MRHISQGVAESSNNKISKCGDSVNNIMVQLTNGLSSMAKRGLII